MNKLAQKVFNDLEKVRHEKPLVHNITNYVVMNNTANALLAIGASPVMAHATEEVADMVNIASALAVNIGTLSRHWVDAMSVAMKVAQDRGVPIVFDPVGAGATPYRNETCRKLLQEVPPTVLRGNPSEIMAVAGALEIDYKNKDNDIKTKGVDSTVQSNSAVTAAKELAKFLGCVVSVSGETDYIVDEEKVNEVHNGHEMMPLITGLGCTATSLTAAFAGVCESPYDAALDAMIIMGIAGEISAEDSIGPGTMQLEFIDALYTIDYEQVSLRIRVNNP